MSTATTHRAIDAVWRIESARLIAGLARFAAGDVGLAEELAQDALVAALEQWPESGVPDNPGAWLMAAAKRKGVDQFRRRENYDRKLGEIARDTVDSHDPTDLVAADLDDEIGDDLLRLIFISCHPVLSTEARVALTLRLLGGLTTDEIARAFLTPEPTVAQRIVRAKKTLADKKIPYEVPSGAELATRLESVLEVIYLIFNEGYSATAGDNWMRPGLCTDALRLARIVAQRMPAEPEVHGLVALLEIQASRQGARTAPDGSPILLLEQNRARWNQLAIRRGLAALEKAELMQPAGDPSGRYALQAAIAACHARARRPEDTGWEAIAAHYRELSELTGSPVVELNRAVALSMAYGPKLGLELVDQLVDDPALQTYHLLPSVRGDLLEKLGRRGEARVEFERAAELTRNERERALLLDRAATCADPGHLV